MHLRAAVAILAVAGLALTGCVPAEALAPPMGSVSVPSTTRPAPLPEIRIDSVLNFRDLAGTGEGLPRGPSGHLARGVIFRSGRLKDLSEADKRLLIRAGITDIFDLRTTEVARRSPDPALGGAQYHLINIFGVYSYPTQPATTVEEAIAQREQLNRDFVTDSVQRRRIGLLFEGIVKAKGPVIVHCSEGKDRTGWVSAILQLLAGADEKTVVEDYLVSNRRRAKSVEASVAEVRKAEGRTAAQIARVRLEVRERYLRAGLDELTSRYGDVNGYLIKGVGLSPATISRLRDKLIRH